jgi:hypothetical protein
VKFVGYLIGTCDGVEINKPLVVEYDNLHVHVTAGEVDILSLDPAHIALLEGFYGQAMNASLTRRERLMQRLSAETDRLGSGRLALGLLAVTLFLIGF